MNASTLARYHKMSDLVNPRYDSVVDRTDFKKGQDKERAMRLTGDTGGSTTNGVYDFPDGKFDASKEPTPVMLALRSGKLDKADVDTLKRFQDNVAKDEQKLNKDAKEKSHREAIENARQSFIDSQTGFDSSSVNSN